MHEPTEDLQVDPARLTDNELTAVHDRLAAWVEEALSPSSRAAPSEQLYDRVYDKLSEISRERAERQREDREGPPRPDPFG